MRVVGGGQDDDHLDIYMRRRKTDVEASEITSLWPRVAGGLTWMGS